MIALVATRCLINKIMHTHRLEHVYLVPAIQTQQRIAIFYLTMKRVLTLPNPQTKTHQKRMTKHTIPQKHPRMLLINAKEKIIGWAAEFAKPSVNTETLMALFMQLMKTKTMRVIDCF